LLGELSYPCALKPREAHLFDRSFENQKLFVVRSEKELLEKLDTLEKLGLKMMVTEIIPGKEDRFVSFWTYLDAEGRPLFEFTKRKYRQFPIHFGLGTLHASERVPGVGELGLRFLRAIDLCGPAVIEFKQDPRDGAFKLIECNARFTKAADVIVRAGIDMPLLVYNHLARRPLPTVDGYREGVRLWFPLEDLKALRALRRNGELTLGDWLPTFLPPWNVALFNWRDPWPAVAYTLSRVLGRLLG
jgi:predicted ATP-grasp superfamily ATP-dependent carboligase